MLHKSVHLKPSQRFAVLSFVVLNALLLASVLLEGDGSPPLRSRLFPILRDLLTLNIAVWAASAALLDSPVVTAAVLDEDATEDEESMAIPVVVSADAASCSVLALAASLSDVTCRDADDPGVTVDGTVSCRLSCGDALPAKIARCTLLLRKPVGSPDAVDMQARLVLNADVSLRSGVCSPEFDIPLRTVL